jgi:hypothetical protein
MQPVRVNAPAISHSVTFSEFLSAWMEEATMAAIAAYEKNRMLSPAGMNPGRSTPMMKNAGPTISRLNSASTPNDRSE